MTMRSIPPTSSNFALIPVPAPPPIIGTPASMRSRSLASVCSRLKIMNVFQLLLVIALYFLLDELKQHLDRPFCKDCIVDIGVHLDEWNLGVKSLAQGGKHSLIGAAVAEGL